MSSDEQRTWGRIGGLRAHALNGSRVMTGPAHRGFRARFVRQVQDAAAARDEVLNPEELEIRADRLQRAHMLELAARSAAVRRRRPPDPR